MAEKKYDLPRARAVAMATISEWLPGWTDGQDRGDERFIRSPLRPDESIGSFSINRATGLWHDFATSEGGSLLDLYGRILGKDWRAAAEQLVPVEPPPPRLGYSKRYDFAGVDCAFSIFRYEATADDKKSFLPMHGSLDGWKTAMPPRPAGGFPLYRLPEILSDDKAIIVLTEGEKAAEAIPAPYIGATWPGGAARVADADFRPLRGRRVILWPDADEAGGKAMDRAAERLSKVGASVSRITPRSTWREKTDAADLEQGEVLAVLSTAQAEAQGSSTALRFERIGDIEAAPPEYVVHGLIEAGNLVLVFGHSGDGKSFAVLDLAIAGATGRPFAGHSVERVGPWLIAPGEGRAGLLRRARAAAKGQGLDLRAIPLLVANKGAELLSSEGFQELRDAVRSATRLHGAVRGLIIDTLPRALAPGDENSSQDVGEAIRRLDALRHENPGLVIVLVHHSGHADKERARGSSALRAAVDAEFKITRDGRSGAIVMACTKLKDGELPEPMSFELVDEHLGQDPDGRAIRSAWARFVGTGIASKPASGKNQAQALDILRTLYDRQRANLAASGMDPIGARVKLSEWRHGLREAGIDRRRHSEVQGSLVDAGLIEIHEPYVQLVSAAVSEAVSESGGTTYPPDNSDTYGRPKSDISDTFGHFGQDRGEL